MSSNQGSSPLFTLSLILGKNSKPVSVRGCQHYSTGQLGMSHILGFPESGPWHPWHAQDNSINLKDKWQAEVLIHKPTYCRIRSIKWCFNYASKLETAAAAERLPARPALTVPVGSFGTAPKCHHGQLRLPRTLCAWPAGATEPETLGACNRGCPNGPWWNGKHQSLGRRKQRSSDPVHRLEFGSLLCQPC